MHPEAVGWDWIGMNLDDGSALTAFRLRRKDGSTLWDGGSFRSARGELLRRAARARRSSARNDVDQSAVERELSGGVDRAHAGRLLHRARRRRQPGTGQPRVDRRDLLGRAGGADRQQWEARWGGGIWR